jgi:hypothetical protein
MGCQIAVRSFIAVLFSTLFVYKPAFGQSADELYRHLKAHPNLSKDEVDQAKADKLDQGRVKTLHDDLDANRKREADLNRRADAQPDVPDPPESKDIDHDKSATAPVRAASAPLKPGAAPSSGSGSSDTPKVAFDPMPDEIHFEGEDTPTPKRAIKPPPRRLKNH